MELEHEKAQHAELLRREKEQSLLEIEKIKASREQELAKMEGMKAMGVDLTSYLVALATTKPDQHVKIDAGSGSTPALHFALPTGK